ncbi:MAG: hypothetical protein PHQ98_04605 [Candidatus ainarchaeum sp.]|nr:hypothetical protein [Candidatus ainarchaeum sp.]
MPTQRNSKISKTSKVASKNLTRKVVASRIKQQAGIRSKRGLKQTDSPQFHFELFESRLKRSIRRNNAIGYSRNVGFLKSKHFSGVDADWMHPNVKAEMRKYLIDDIFSIKDPNFKENMFSFLNTFSKMDHKNNQKSRIYVFSEIAKLAKKNNLSPFQVKQFLLSHISLIEKRINNYSKFVHSLKYSSTIQSKEEYFRVNASVAYANLLTPFSLELSYFENLKKLIEEI